MKTGTLALSVALLGLLSAVAYLAGRPHAAAAPDPRVGTTLVSAAAASRTARLVVSDQGKSAVVERGADGAWRVPGYHGFPADFAKVSRFVTDLTEARFVRFASFHKTCNRSFVHHGDTV